MNKRIIFHIGPPKTGSSAIQLFLHSHRKTLASLGVIYPKHSIDGNGISSGNAREVCSEGSDGRLVLDGQKLSRVLSAFENNQNSRILLLSSESFFRIVDDITRVLPHAEIICFVRNPVEYQLSIYNQSVKRHGNQSLFQPNQRLNLGQWETLLKVGEQISPDQFHCFAYKPPGHKNNVISDVLEVLGLRDQFNVPGHAVNVSYSFAALEVKRWLNKFRLETLQADIDTYLQAASQNAPRYRLINDDLLKNYRSQLEAVTARFEKLLSDPDSQSITRALSELTELPIRQQPASYDEIAELAARLKREKPALYRAISLLVSKSEGSDKDPFAELFRASQFQLLFGKLALFPKSALKKMKHIKGSSEPNIPFLQIPEELKQAVRLSDIELLPLVDGSNPARVKGGIRGSAVPGFAQQFRFTDVRQNAPMKMSVTHLDVINEYPETSDFKGGEYYYGGPVFSNFGHFLAECIHRLAPFEALRQESSVKQVIFQPHRYRRKAGLVLPVLPAHFYDVLSYLGISRNAVLIQHKAFKVEKLWVAPQQSYFRSREPVSKAYLDFLSDCEKRANIGTDTSYPERIYISRTPFMLRGSFAGELYLERLLSKQGYSIFRPEALSIREQLMHYKNAKEIVVAEGAALHVMELMGKIPGRVTVIQRRKLTSRMFAPLLKPRAADIAFFEDVRELPSLFVPQGQQSAAHGSAMSVLNASLFETFISNRLNIRDFNQEEFHSQIAKDIKTYYNTYAPALLDNKSLTSIPVRFTVAVKEMQQEGMLIMAEDWDNLEQR